jgi:putative aldouronate transport system permease protein
MVYKKMLKHWQLYIFVFPAMLYFLVFHYYPVYGVQIAFKDFIASKGIWGSEWIGLDHFVRFFNSHYFWTLIRNTLMINLYQLALFPISIIVALSMNELKNGFFKNFTQTVTYALILFQLWSCPVWLLPF